MSGAERGASGERSGERAGSVAGSERGAERGASGERSVQNIVGARSRFLSKGWSDRSKLICLKCVKGT